MTIIDLLKTHVAPAQVLTSEEEKAYAKLDQSSNVKPSSPMVVVKVHNSDELCAVVQCCIKAKQPLVIRAAGTGKSGGAVGAHNSVVIDITNLNRIIAIDVENMTAEIEPGVVLGDFQAAVKSHGLYYPPDPASWATCTLGGNVAENAGGPSTLKYGCTKEYLLGGQAIIGTGEVIDFGKRCPKGVAGYDIASLLCGSEGTLAVFSKLTLRLLPLPKDECAGLFLFSDDEKALEGVNTILHHGHLPKTLEFIDGYCLNALKKSGHLTHLEPGISALLIECDASFEGGAKEQLKAILERLKASVIRAELAHSAEERKIAWQARSNLSEACSKFLGHKISEDIAIPLSKMQAFSAWFKAKELSPHLLCALFGHAGDGNLHVQIMYAHEKYRARAEELRHQVLLKILDLGGTLSAEHGIGLQKKAYLPLEQSAALIDLQKRIKQAFDPNHLLNPGKIFDK
jgi:glycolate oxidase